MKTRLVLDQRGLDGKPQTMASHIFGWAPMPSVFTLLTHALWSESNVGVWLEEIW